MPAKLVVLGIDAMSPNLVRRLVAEGKLPAIGALLQSGVSGSVQGVEGFFIGSTWPSFYTGLNPAGHGFHRIVQLRDESYEFFRPLDEAEGVGGTPLWRAASDAGRRVAVLDVPLSCPEDGLNGVQVVEWGGHDAVFGFTVQPAALREEITTNVGSYPAPTNCDLARSSAAEFEEFLQSLELAISKKTDLTLDVLESEPWDLFMQVFTESHCAGHQCWHIHDPAHPAHDPQLLAELGDPMQRIYQALDGAVAAILERAPDTPVLLLSAHGMSYYRGAGFLLPEILFRLGVTARPDQGHRKSGPLLRTARSAWRRLPKSVRDTIRRPRATLGPGSSASNPLPRLRFDVANSRCFPIANGQPVGGIRINLLGREPSGVVEPGADADDFCESLASDLLAIVDERTGEPLVAAVQRTDALYKGARLGALPDLLVEWNGELATGTQAHGSGRGATVRAHSTKIGSIEGTNSYVRTGDHIPDGFWAYASPTLNGGGQGGDVSLMDFYPTICRLLDVPHPAVDGAVVKAIVRHGQ